MKIIAVGFVLAICICGNSLSLADDSRSQDDGCIELDAIEKWIETPSGWSKGMWYPEGSSWIEISLRRAGDCVALWIIRGYNLGDLLDPDTERLDRILSLIRMAFKYPKYIIDKEYKNPAVTMLLLSALEKNCTDGERKDKIIDLKKYILSQNGIRLPKNRSGK